MIQHLVREVERMSKDLDKVKDELYVMQKDQKVPYESNVVLQCNKKRGGRAIPPAPEQQQILIFSFF